MNYPPVIALKGSDFQGRLQDMEKRKAIYGAIDELKLVLQNGTRAVLSAPPGTGKTTMLPQEFLKEEWMSGKKIILLQPRRAAARAAAYRIADLLGEEAGETAGWIIRGERKISKATRIEIVTEGVLTRLLQSNPELEGVGMVIFDEFHERSLNTDLGLALCMETQAALRDDLRILVMSATIDTGQVAELLENCLAIKCEAETFPVKTQWESSCDLWDLPEKTAGIIMRTIMEESGSLLVFLPGAREIINTENLLKNRLTSDFIIAPLYGSLDRKAQDAALLPAPGGKRKIVLSTNIAETSLTIEGIRIVIDSGYARKDTYDPSTGINTLRTVKISKASAEQRKGRAGRLEPGTCIRLWSELEHRGLKDFDNPEILDADLTQFCLELALWGTDAEKMHWLNPPPEAALAAGKELLLELGAIDKTHRITHLGKKLAALPIHPRLGIMILRAGELGMGALACEIAALLEERDILDNQEARVNTDLRERVRIFRQISASQNQKWNYRNLLTIRDQLLRLTGTRFTECDIEYTGLVAAFAYPDRIAKKRKNDSSNYLMSNGHGARFMNKEAVSRCEFVTITKLDGAGSDAKVQLAAPLAEEDLIKYFGKMITSADTVKFDHTTGAIAARRETKLGEIVLTSTPLNQPPQELVAEALIAGIRATGLHVLPWDNASNSMRERVIFARRLASENWPDWTDEGLMETLEDWLAPFLSNIRSMDALKKLDMQQVLSTALGYELDNKLKKEFPERFTAETGSSIRIDYSGTEPEMPVKVQEMFGCSKHPSINNGKIKLRVRLLSPAMRPVQVTSDLPTFWKTSWELVKKDMKGRYPKHYWPDNPAEADPTRGTKPRG